MSTQGWIETGLFAVIVLVALAMIPRMWRGGPTSLEGNAPSWWFWGDVMFRGWRRALVSATVASAALIGNVVVGATTIGEGEHASGRGGVLYGASVAVLAAALLVVLGVVLFNRPKFAVPPHRRREPGALDEWRRARRKRRVR